MNHARAFALLTLSGAALFMGGCGKPSADTASAAAADTPKPADAFPGMEADLARTIKAEPDYYKFKTMADFAKETQGLTWEDGSDLPSYADPAAKKGGTLTLKVPDFPGTLRSIGPNSNASFRQYLNDYTCLAIVRAHP
ncbi:MAG TPA: hypothetical protein VIJ19_06965, partial [Opitutaceae bacterium]